MKSPKTKKSLVSKKNKKTKSLGCKNKQIRVSSAVEQVPVKDKVLGSNPRLGATFAGQSDLDAFESLAKFMGWKIVTVKAAK